jgi:hypothetical protein
MNRYSHSNEFNHVEKLILSVNDIRDNLSYYFTNVTSLIFTSIYHEADECKLLSNIKYLPMVVSLSSIKHLTIINQRYITSVSLLNILKALPHVSSLMIDKQNLMSCLNNDELCKCLNEKIITLNISNDLDTFIQSNEIDLFCKTFSNLEHLQCHLNVLDDLVFILAKCSKLSMIKIRGSSNQIYSWIQINASIFNVYFDFTFIHYIN